MGASVNATPSQPRNCGRQQHRPNVPQDSIEEWYRVNAAIPFLDHVITELDSQFSSLSLTCSRLLNLVPSVMCSNTHFDFAELLQLYKDDLPSPELFEQEFSRWKLKFSTSCYTST